MLAAIPIVATRAGGVPELIEDGKQGLLVQPGSAMELCEALVRMLEADTDRHESGNVSIEPGIWYLMYRTNELQGEH